MYLAPTLSKLNLAEYQRILAQPTELRAPAPRPPTHDLAMIELELADTRAKLQQVEQLHLVLETKVIFLRRQIRSVRRAMYNAGWPVAERRRAHRSKV